MKCKNMNGKIQKKKQKANNKFRINNIKKQELKEQGVTMLSLVVTIVVLLILSGITIKFALNDNGVIKQSKLASEKYKNSTIQEQIALNDAINIMRSSSSSSGSSSESDSDDGDENTEELVKQIEDLQNQIKELNDQINNLKTKQATGNATVSQVLSGATFSTSAGIGLTGTMKNNGAWTANTTGSGNITIPAGYHNGQGYVSGAGAYNKGVSDADARVNTSSASYNKGVSDADARVNTSSASYKSGYANGDKTHTIRCDVLHDWSNDKNGLVVYVDGTQIHYEYGPWQARSYTFTN